MTKIEGSAFVELDNLKVLDLSYNQLTGNWT
jgi:Leucine-rich repeat (LRR) protein